MININWSDWIPDLVKAPIEIYKNRKLIQNLYKKFQAYADVGHTNILIDGRPAVGKSTFLKQLVDETKALPEKSIDIETKPILMGEWTHLVRALPGDEGTPRTRAINKHLLSYKLNGVVYVVDNGFTDPRDKVIINSLINKEGKKTIKDLRDYNLEKELKHFEKFMDRIIGLNKDKTPEFLIIAVNKIDLFMNKIDDAQDYYDVNGSSSFSDLLKNGLSTIGKRHIKIATLPVCAWQGDFEWNKKTTKTKLGGTGIHNSLIANFVNTVANFSK